jgi:hypothetical protein
MECVDFNILKGLTFKAVYKEDALIFETVDGRKFSQRHNQSCCEQVYLEEIHGELSDLIGSPILLAEVVYSSENPPGIIMEYQDQFTWSFCKLSTIKGSVTLRWYGDSNGYYSTTPNLYEYVSSYNPDNA